MKHAFAWVTALAVALPLPLSAEGQNMTQDQQDVLQAILDMTSSFQRKDIARVMASYEGQATVVFEPDAPIADAATIEQMFTGMSALDPTFDYPAGHEVIVNGDIAIHISPWVMSAQDADGQPISGGGLSVAVLRRQADGSWKMVIDNPHSGRLLASD